MLTLEQRLGVECFYPVIVQTGRHASRRLDLETASYGPGGARFEAALATFDRLVSQCAAKPQHSVALRLASI